MVRVMLISYKIPGVGNGHLLLLTAEEGCMFMRLNYVYTSCASDTGLYLGSFSLRNCRFSCNGCGLQAFLFGPHPPDLKVVG